MWLINISHCHPIPYILYLIQSSSHRATVYLTAIGREGSTVAEIFSFHPTLKLWQVLLPTGHWRKQQPSPTPRHGHHHHHHRISHPTRHQQQLLMLQSQHFHPSARLSLLNSLWPLALQVSKVQWTNSKARPNAVDQFSYGRFVWLPKPKTCIWFCVQLGTNVVKHIWVNFLLFSKKAFIRIPYIDFSYLYQLCMYAPKLDLLHFILISVPLVSWRFSFRSAQLLSRPRRTQRGKSRAFAPCRGEERNVSGNDDRIGEWSAEQLHAWPKIQPTDWSTNT